MIRETLDSGSVYFSLFVMGGSNGLSKQWRTCYGCITYGDINASVDGRNTGLRVTKIGNTFQAYFKIFGSDDWVPLGSAETLEFSPWSGMFDVGIAVTSNDNNKTADLLLSHAPQSLLDSARQNDSVIDSSFGSSSSSAPAANIVVSFSIYFLLLFQIDFLISYPFTDSIQSTKAGKSKGRKRMHMSTIPSQKPVVCVYSDFKVTYSFPIQYLIFFFLLVCFNTE